MRAAGWLPTLAISLAAAGCGSNAGPPELKSPVSALIHIGLPQWQLAAGQGAAWVGDYEHGDLVRVDARTGATTRYRIGDPAAVHTDPRVAQLPSSVLVADGAVWVTKNDTHAILKLNPRDGRVEATMRLDVNPYGLTSAAGSIWVSCWDAAKLIRIDPSTNRVVDIFDAVNASPGLAVANGAAWIVYRPDDSIVRLDLATRRITSKVKVPHGPAGILALDCVIWVASEGSSALSSIDPLTGSVVSIAHLDLAQDLLGLTTDGRYLYVGGIVRFDPRTNAVAGSVTLTEAFGGGIAYADGALWVQGSGGVIRVLTSVFGRRSQVTAWVAPLRARRSW